MVCVAELKKVVEYVFPIDEDEFFKKMSTAKFQQLLAKKTTFGFDTQVLSRMVTPIHLETMRVVEPNESQCTLPEDLGGISCIKKYSTSVVAGAKKGAGEVPGRKEGLAKRVMVSGIGESVRLNSVSGRFRGGGGLGDKGDGGVLKNPFMMGASTKKSDNESI